MLAFFAGIGGMDLGGLKNGFETKYANDWHKASKQFYQNNYKEVAFDQCDVRLVTLNRINEVLQKHGYDTISAGEIDVLTGGSPCVKISAANTKDARQFAEENFLMLETLIDIVREVKPKIAWFENSDRILGKGNEALMLDFETRMHHFLPDYNYQIKVMYAPRYGGYQTRSRAMTVLVRKDILRGRDISFFPAPSKIDLTKQGVDVLLPWVESFWQGQFDKKYKPALGNLFSTLTANGRPYVIDCTGEERLLSLEEKQILTGMTGYDYSDICPTNQNILLGNMVLPQLSERMFKHFKEVILT